MGKERGRDRGRKVNGEGERQRKKGEWGRREAETEEEW